MLYSINVFITFVLSQLGMVRHWWQVRGGAPHWRKGLCLNGLGLVLTAFILVMVTCVKFFEGGWITLVITGALVAVALSIRRHYNEVGRRIRKLDVLRAVVDPQNPYTPPIPKNPAAQAEPDLTAPTAVLFVSGFNGLGIHTLLSVIRLFGKDIKNYVFVQIGVVDAAVFRGAAELARLKTRMAEDLDRYVAVMGDRLAALGYRRVVTRAATPLGPAGTVLRGHEFHYSRLTDETGAVPDVYALSGRQGAIETREGFLVENTLGSYVHLHFGSNPQAARNFVRACLEGR